MAPSIGPCADPALIRRVQIASLLQLLEVFSVRKAFMSAGHLTVGRYVVAFPRTNEFAHSGRESRVVVSCTKGLLAK